MNATADSPRPACRDLCTVARAPQEFPTDPSVHLAVFRARSTAAHSATTWHAPPIPGPLADNTTVRRVGFTRRIETSVHHTVVCSSGAEKSFAQGEASLTCIKSSDASAGSGGGDGCVVRARNTALAGTASPSTTIGVANLQAVSTSMD